jgi:hypothetical protein
LFTEGLHDDAVALLDELQVEMPSGGSIMGDKQPRTGLGVPLRRMARPVGIVLTSLFLGYVLQSAIRIVLWRSHWQPGLDAMRRFNKKFTKASAATKLGKKGSMTTAVHHVGRRSGQPHVTPVWAERVGETFFIQLPYGTGLACGRRHAECRASSERSRTCGWISPGSQAPRTAGQAPSPR